MLNVPKPVNDWALITGASSGIGWELAKLFAADKFNLVLVALPQPVWDGLVADGYSFSRRGAPAEGIVRIACAFDTTTEDVDALVAAAHRHAGTTLRPERPEPAMR